MKYLVTGGSGFIGTHLVSALVKNSDDVAIIDIARPKLEAQVPLWRQCDILDREKLKAVFTDFAPDCVIHLAARTDTLSTDLRDYRVNIQGSRNVFEVSNEQSSLVRLIHTSTQFVNQYAGVPSSDTDYAPHTTYGESKVFAEKLLREIVTEKVWTIVRPTNVWGPWHPRYPHEFWKVLARGLYFHPGGATVIRSYGYVGNVVAQMLCMAACDQVLVDKEVFYVGDEPIQLLEWVNGFSMAQIGKTVRVIPRPLLRMVATLGDLFNVIGLQFPLTSSRFKSMTESNATSMHKTFELCGSPSINLQQGIEETVSWLRIRHPGLVRV